MSLVVYRNPNTVSGLEQSSGQGSSYKPTAMYKDLKDLQATVNSKEKTEENLKPVVRKVASLVKPYKQLTSPTSLLYPSVRMILLKEIRNLETAMVLAGFKNKAGESYDSKLQALFDHFLRLHKDVSGEARIVFRSPDEVVIKIASFLPANEGSFFLKMSGCTNYYEGLADIVNQQKVPLAKLNLTLKELKLLAPYLTYVDTSQLKLDFKDIAELLGLCVKVQHLVLNLGGSYRIYHQLNPLINRVKSIAPKLNYVDFSTDYFFWLSAFFPEECDLYTRDLLNNWPSKNIKKLCIPTNRLEVDDLMVAAPYLTKVSLYNPYNTVLKLLKNCTQLKTLRLFWSEKQQPNFTSLGDCLVSPYLKELELENWHNLESLPDNLPIEVLRLTNCEGLKTLPLHMKNLRSFQLQSNNQDMPIPSYPQFKWIPVESKDIKPKPGTVVNVLCLFADVNKKIMILKTIPCIYVKEGQWDITERYPLETELVEMFAWQPKQDTLDQGKAPGKIKKYK